MLGLPDHVRAGLFDLDGVLTDTARVHKTAWKAMFDEFLREHAEQGRAFSDDDYRTYVDGKTRYDGVRSFLASRDIRLPEGDAVDAPDVETVHGLANRKNDLFHERLHTDGVTVFAGSRRYLQAATAAGIEVAVVSSSANTAEVLEIAGLASLVKCRVDGITIRTEHLKGKPAPDSYLWAAKQVGVAPSDAAVFEDALSGVEAGRAGHFGFVVGVDRTGQPEALRRSGADVVVTDLAELLTA